MNLTDQRKKEKNIASFSSISLRGSNTDISHYSQPEEEEIKSPMISNKDNTFDSIKNCLEINDFTDQEERNLWDILCHEMPLSTTYAKRITFLAIEECNKHGNPLSAINTGWIQAMNMDNERVTFECFHLPDRDD